MLESMMMDAQQTQISDLQTLNEISQMLNQSVDVQGALNKTLAKVVDLMGLETGWVFIRDSVSNDRWAGRGYRLAAQCNLPDSLALTNPEAWDKGCDCQTLCNNGQLNEAYNEVKCSRLASVSGPTDGLAVHASTPLRSGDRILGILNVAAPDWSFFTPRSLALLTNIGSQIGIALERNRLYEMTQQQRVHEQLALLDLSQQLLSRRDLDDLVQFIVEEARALVDADASALLLPGELGEYLYFTASSGWHGHPVDDGYRVPADDSTGSGRVMSSQQVMLIEDTEVHDPPLWSSGWLAQEGFRAAAIFPLIAAGNAIGTLVIDSRQPRRFAQSEIRLLRLMANQAALAIEKARLHQQELKQQRILEELAVARSIQLSMLPDQCPELPGWEFATFFESANQVGGDFYDFFPLPGEPDGRWAIVIADVSDKGVPAALFMALSRTTIRNVALRGRQPAEVLVWANRFIQEDSQADMFLTAFFGELNPETGQVRYASAGHNPPLWWHAADQQFSRLNPTGPLLGVLDDIELVEEQVTLLPGDCLVLYTDGATDVVNEMYDEFGLDRLQATVRAVFTANPSASAAVVQTTITEALHDFAGAAEQYDDMTLFVIRREPESGEA